MLANSPSVADDVLLAQLRGFVGDSHVITDERRNRRFRKGYRYGEGKVLAVVRPGTLVEQWQAFKACVEAGRIVILNAANTGLNGGSTPFGDDYDRQVVVINTLRIGRIDLLEGWRTGAVPRRSDAAPVGEADPAAGTRAAFGYRLDDDRRLGGGWHLQQFRRRAAAARSRLHPAGAVCPRRRGRQRVAGQPPRASSLAMTPRRFWPASIAASTGDDDVWHDTGKLASDPDYSTLVRDIEAPGPARFNNDPRLLFEAAGSAGKLCVFAVRLDTFPSSGPSRVFYIGSNDHMELTEIRRHILGTFKTLPVAGEYLHHDAYTLAEKYGKDLYLLIKHAGTERIPTAFALKSRFDAITGQLGLGTNVSDRLLQVATGLLPNHLPARMNAFRDSYKHHLLLRMDGEGIDEARAYLGSLFPSASGDFFECDDEEAAAAFRNRYAVGGGSVRYRAVNPDTVENIVALDLALPRNTIDWRETLPRRASKTSIERRIPCGHFFCQVFHYDYAVKKGTDWLEIEHKIIAHLNGRGIEFPSEHNVGHLYTAKPVLADFYRSLDPTNTLNPGIGQTSKRKDWA